MSFSKSMPLENNYDINDNSVIFTTPKNLNFFLTFCKNRKKFDRYVKNNKIRNKYIIDIARIIEEENISLDNPVSQKYFRIIITKRIEQAVEKEKDIYYIPNLNNSNIDIQKIFNLKTFLNHHNFNLLTFYNEFNDNEKKYYLDQICKNLTYFDSCQILEDY